MTAYELAVSLPMERREMMAEAGLMPRSVGRYIHIYECWRGLVDGGTPRMEAYEEVSRRCFTCVENVRKIVGRMSAEVAQPKAH